MSLTDTNFRVVSDPDGPDYVVKAEGGIDLDSAVGFQEALLDGLVTFPNRLIIDMSQVSSFDTAGTDVLLSTHQRGKAIGTELVVQTPSPAVRECLDSAGVTVLRVRHAPD